MKLIPILLLFPRTSIQLSGEWLDPYFSSFAFFLTCFILDSFLSGILHNCCPGTSFCLHSGDSLILSPILKMLLPGPNLPLYWFTLSFCWCTTFNNFLCGEAWCILFEILLVSCLKFLLDKQMLRELIITRPASPEVLNGMLNMERKDHC